MIDVHCLQFILCDIPSLGPVSKLILHCFLQTDQTILEKEVTNRVVLPDIIRPEKQAIQLMVMEENNQYTLSTIGVVLTVRQLIFYCGIALVVAVAVLLAGILLSFQ